MTIKKAKKLGYKVVAVSDFEVGLVKNGVGVRTWWLNEFGELLGRKLPSLAHTTIQRSIDINEQLESDRRNKQ